MKPRDPAKSRLREAVGSARLVGGLFVVLGGLPLWLAYKQSASIGVDVQILSAVTAVILIGPGVWYFLAGGFLKRHQPWVARTTTQIALCQFAAMALATLTSQIVDRSHSHVFFVPAVLAVFFLPALIVTILQMRCAAREEWNAEGHGFTVEVIPAEPIDSPPASLTESPAESIKG